MAAFIPFRPDNAGTVSQAISGASARVQVTPTGSRGNYSASFYNSGTADCFIAWGDNTITASAAGGYPIAPGSKEVLTISGTHVAVIGTSGTLYITDGEGA